MFLNVSVSMRSFWWVQLYVNLFQHLSFHNLFHLMHGELQMRRTRVPSNVTRSTKLKGAQRSSELAFRSTDFRVPENLTYLALINHLNLPKQLHQFL